MCWPLIGETTRGNIDRPTMELANDRGCFLRSFPPRIAGKPLGHPGKTIVYLNWGKSERRTYNFPWYNPSGVYIQCKVSDGKTTGISVVSVRRPTSAKPALSQEPILTFFFKGKEVKRYASKDLLAQNKQALLADLKQIKEVFGYRAVGHFRFVFEFGLNDQRILAFNPATGILMSR